MTRLLPAIAAWLMLGLLSVQAAPALVSSDWLHDNRDNKQLLIIDLRNRQFFDYARIPGSVHSDYASWRAADARGINKMLPSKAHIEKLLSAIGATPESHIVLIHSGQSADELASAARVFWTLEQIHHAKKSILDGGIIDYANRRLPLVRGGYEVTASEYRIANGIRPQLKADELNKNPGWNRIDARSRAEFLGIYQVPGENPGTIPGSRSLPFDWLTQNGSGQLQKTDNLKTLMTTLELKPAERNVYFCHTGHRAALSWFVAAQILGDKNAVLFDGSTAEWAVRKDLDTERQLKIEL